MDNILENPTEQPSVSDKDIFTRIWTSPRETFRYLEHHQYEKYFFILLVLAGISRAFTQAVTQQEGAEETLWLVITKVLFVGGLFGWISVSIYALFVRWIGNLLRGKADINAVLRVLAYSSIPTVMGLLLLIPQIALYGNEMFQQEMGFHSGEFFSNYMLMSVVVPQGILTIWSIVLMIIGISEIQKFSISVSILNLFLSIVAVAITFALLVKLMMIVFGTV